MKLKTFSLATVFCLFFSSFSAFAAFGTRGGGNIAAAQFSGVAQNIIFKMNSLGDIVINNFKIDSRRLQSTFEKTKVFTVDQPLSLDGKSVQAINDPRKLEIVFNKNAWATLDHDQRVQLVAHELLGLTFHEISDLNYTYSAQLLEVIKNNSHDDLKIHCRLSVTNQNSSLDYEVLDESMTWVPNGTTSQDALENFEIYFTLKDFYLLIQLKNSAGKTLVSQNQYVKSGLDFESQVLFETTVDGKTYDTMNLMCEEALGNALKN